MIPDIIQFLCPGPSTTLYACVGTRPRQPSSALDYPEAFTSECPLASWCHHTYILLRITFTLSLSMYFVTRYTFDDIPNPEQRASIAVNAGQLLAVRGRMLGGVCAARNEGLAHRDLY